MHGHDGQHQASVPAGTVFEDTRNPLRLWFHVLWILVAQKTGMSARPLWERYGLGSYQTAWVWLHKRRSVMIRSGREMLAERVAVDETHIGGRKKGKRGRGSEGNALGLVAVEGTALKRGRVRFRGVEKAHAVRIKPFVKDSVYAGTLVKRDGLPSYNGLKQAGFNPPPLWFFLPEVSELAKNGILSISSYRY